MRQGTSMSRCADRVCSPCCCWLPTRPLATALLRPPPHPRHPCPCPRARSAIGCRDTDCSLCQYNPNRICDRDFGKKYLVGDVLKAKCGAPIKVEVQDQQGRAFKGMLPGLHLEAVLVDGVAYKDRGGDGKVLGEDELKGCFKLTNHRVSHLALARRRRSPGLRSLAARVWAARPGQAPAVRLPR
jgi:hypothetical protein